MPSLEQFMGNAEEGMEDYKLTPGPFGFGYAVSLRSAEKQCLKRTPYATSGDCTFDPKTCKADGFSVSIWVRANFSYSVFYTVHTLHKEKKRYVLSTGGDDAGHPGIAIYHQGLALTAIVSTGDTYWKLEVLGPFANSDWNNVGIRWDATHGLELYGNAHKVGHAHYAKPSIRKEPLNPTEMLVGCHKDSDNVLYRNYHDADFDEFAFWGRRLPDEQTIFFLGGFEGHSENMSPAEFSAMLQRTDLRDPEQAKIAVEMFNSMTDQLSNLGDDPPPKTNGTTTTGNKTTNATAPVVNAGALKLKGMAEAFRGLTKPAMIKKGINIAELDIYSDVIKAASKMLNESLDKKWDQVEGTGHEGASMVKADVEAYVTQLAKNLQFNAPFMPKNFTKITDNIVVKIDKMTVNDYERLGPYYVTPNYRESKGMKALWVDWNTPPDKVEVPTNIYTDRSCKFQPMSVVTVYYDSLDDVGPERLNPSTVNTKVKNELDSRLVSVLIANDPPTQPRAPACSFNETRMKKNPLFYKLEHKSKVPAHRGLKYHQSEVTSLVYRRLCVWWNPTEGQNGSWDSSGCSMLASNEFFSKCACNHLGTYGIMAEHVAEKKIPIEPDWLKILKFILYIVSAICLLFYILVVALSGALKEQFHLSGMCLAACVLGGSIAILMSEDQNIRKDRHFCTAVGTIIHSLYVLGAGWVAVLTHAGFKAVTAGIIVGHMTSYALIPSGLTLVSVGLSYIFFIHELGTDPRCFISWYDDVKLILFFLPVMMFACVGIFLTIVIWCNMRHAKMTKQTVMPDYSSFITGTTVLAFYYPITWVFGIFTYVHVEEDDVGVYPLFHLLNGLMGVIILVCIGICSKKFKGCLAGHAKNKGGLCQKCSKGKDNKKAKKLENEDDGSVTPSPATPSRPATGGNPRPDTPSSPTPPPATYRPPSAL